MLKFDLLDLNHCPEMVAPAREIHSHDILSFIVVITWGQIFGDDSKLLKRFQERHDEEILRKEMKFNRKTLQKYM